MTLNHLIALVLLLASNAWPETDHSFKLHHMATGVTSTYTKVDDQQTFAKVFNPLIQAILSLVTENELPIVAIAGSPGVGKTHFTEMLNTALKAQGVRSAILAGDDFTGRKPAPGALLPFHSTFDNAQCHAFIEALRKGARLLEKPGWTVINDEKIRVCKEVDYTDIDIVLFEHAFALCNESSFDLQQYASIKVLVEAEVESLLEWKWQRGRGYDLQGHTDKAKFLECENVKRELFRNLIEPVVADADYVVFKNGNHDYKLVNQ